MLKILATLPEFKHFKQIQNKGDRYQWADKSTDSFTVLSGDPNPWVKEQSILIRLEQGKRRSGLTYPKRLSLLVLPITEETLPNCQIIRERWNGNFAHSTEPTLLFFAFPIEGDGDRNWLMISIVARRIIGKI